ncbi:MAG: GGDEF domain-containing protein, partial [Gammaproteobacteria bacterium]
PLVTVEPQGRIRCRQRRFLYPAVGAVLAGGAPLGLLLLRRFLLGRRIPLREEVGRDLPTYLYLGVMTTLVFTSLGRALGRHADLLTALSTTDDLTGLLNARAFYPRLAQELERSRRSGAAVSLLLLDLDHLKALNDREGHAAGDRALRRLARMIRQEMRSADIGARVGGDEFVWLAVGAAAPAAEALAERLQRAIAVRTADLPVGLTSSIGMVTFDPAHDRSVSVQDLLRAADRALYQAKGAGRNRAVRGRLPVTPTGAAAI